MRIPALMGLAILVAAPRPGTAVEPPPLALFVQTAESFGETYAARPAAERDATFLFYTGEPIKLRIAVHNRSDAEARFMTRAASAAAAATMTARRDDMPFQLQLVAQVDAVKRLDAFVEPADWSPAIALRPHEAIEWEAEIRGGLAPGIYVLDFAANGTDDRGGAVLGQGSRFGFEIRSRTAADQPEILRREALRQFANGRYEAAGRALDQLQAVHPDSFEARLIRGDIAREEGRVEEATRQYNAAVTLLTAGRDQLFLKFASKTHVQDVLEATRARINTR